MRIAICEDNDVQREILAQMINETDVAVDYEITVFESGEALVNDYEKGQRFDIIFLDVIMKELNGIETGRIIRSLDEKVFIILTTGIIEYAIEGYSIDAFGFLLKPISSDKLKQVLDRVLNEIEDRHKPKYMIVYRDRKILTPIDEILYLESRGRKIVVHTPYNAYPISGKLADEASKFDDHNFVRIHHSFLVNAKYIFAVSAKSVELNNGVVLPISRSKYKEALTVFADH